MLFDCLPRVDSGIVVVVCIQEPVATLRSVGKGELKIVLKNFVALPSILTIENWSLEFRLDLL